MARRTFWTVLGYSAGVASSVVVKRRVRRRVKRYAPAAVRSGIARSRADIVDRAKQASAEFRDVVGEGRRGIAERRMELDEEFAPPSRATRRRRAAS